MFQIFTIDRYFFNNIKLTKTVRGYIVITVSGRYYTIVTI